MTVPETSVPTDRLRGGSMPLSGVLCHLEHTTTIGPRVTART